MDESKGTIRLTATECRDETNQSDSHEISKNVKVLLEEFSDFEYGEIAVIRTLLKCDADLKDTELDTDSIDPSEFTTFITTAITTYSNAFDQQASEPLSTSVTNKCVKVVKKILSNFRQHIFDEVCATVQMLIRIMLYVSIKDGDSHRALKYPGEYSYPSAVKALVEGINVTGAEQNMNPVNSFEDTCLRLAAKNKNAKVFCLLSSAVFLRAIESADAKIVMKVLNSSRQEFASCAELVCIERAKRPFQIRVGAFDTQRPQGSCIGFSDWLKGVYISKRFRWSDIHVGLFTQFFKYEKIVCSTSEDGWTALHLAMLNCQRQNADKAIATFQILLESNKFDVNALTDELETVLHFACRCITSDEYYNLMLLGVTRKILELRVNLNQRNLSGRTAFMVACMNNNSNAVRELINWKVNNGDTLDIDAIDNAGQTALLLARQSNNEKVVTIIKEKLFLTAVENNDIGALNSCTNVTNDEQSRHMELVSERAGSNCNARTRKNVETLGISSAVWTKAVRIAIKNKSEIILKILLKCDAVAEGQGKIGNTILHKLFKNIEADAYNDEQLRLIQMLLEYGKVNVNAMNFESQTALGLILNCGSGFCKKRHDVLFSNAIRLLLRHGANVNEKDQDGYTPLVTASRCMTSMRAILNWTKETNTWLDIDARDGLGRNVLITAVLHYQPEVVEMILNAGASVNASDHCGFTPLHHALCEAFIVGSWLRFEDYPSGFQEWTACSHIPRDLEELKKMQAINSILLKPKAESLFVNSIKTVKLLLEREDVDVNALQYEGFSPLDIAEASIAEIPSYILDTLKKKGANLNIYHRAAKPLLNRSDIYAANANFILYRLAITGFKREVTSSASECLKILKEGFSKLSTSARNDMISAKDRKGRTPLHWATMSCKQLCADTRRTKNHEGLDIQIARFLLSLGCSANETDIYGRTPMHYARRKAFHLLLSYGADETIKDQNGIMAIRKSKKLHSNPDLARGSKSFNKLYSSNSSIATDTVDRALKRIDKSFSLSTDDKSMEALIQTINANSSKPILWCKHLNPTTIFEIVWKHGEYAYRHLSANTIKEEVARIVNDLATEIMNRDSRFEARPLLAGSSNEGTRIGQPDEFDFVFALTRFSELCEVSQSPELPPGFVHLRRKQTKEDPTKEGEFDSFFTEHGSLITEKVRIQFNSILANVLRFIECERNFDWNWHYHHLDDTNYSNTDKPATTLKLKPLKYCRLKTSSVEEISVDIVPCIHIDGYWPDEAITNVSEDIKSSGCILVFDRPQRFYPWVPYSESCVRISFAPAESKMVERSCDTARQAFMMGKQLIKKRYGPKHFVLLERNAEYIMKNCLLYCIEAFEPRSEIFRQIDVSQWLESLMQCVLDFLLQDFCPCYFMPSVCMPIDERPMNYNDPGNPESCQIIFNLRCIFSTHVSRVFLSLPSSNIIFEHFDRRQFLADLSETALRSFEIDSQDLARFDPDTCDDECEHAPLVLETDSDND